MGMVRCRWQACVVGLCLALSAGCAPGKKPTGGTDSHVPAPAAPPAKTAEATSEETLTTPESAETGGNWQRIPGDDPLVIGRVAFYEKSLKAFQELEARAASAEETVDRQELQRACRMAAEQALASYRSLQSGQEQPVTPWQIVDREASYSDKGCERLLAQGRETSLPAPQTSSQAPAEADELTVQLRQKIDAEDYAGAVTVYEEATSPQSQAQPSSLAKRLYGKALVKSGRFDDAVTAYTELLAEAGQRQDLETLALRGEIGDVLLATGRIDDARQVYARLVTVLTPLAEQKEWAEAHSRALNEQIPNESLNRYQDLMQVFLRFDGKQVPPSLPEQVTAMEGETPEPVLGLAKMMLARTRAEAQNWVREQLSEIRSLIAAKELKRAHVQLDQLTAVAAPDTMATVAQLQVELEQAEAAAQQPSAADVAPPADDPWQEAMHRFEQQQYDEAIAGFQPFVGAERGPEAKAKIAEASELAASAMRRQAAALFAKAKNTFDPEAKRQIFLDSRALLEQLIAKYPQAPTVAKARQNLSVINAELGTSAPPPNDAAGPAAP